MPSANAMVDNGTRKRANAMSTTQLHYTEDANAVEANALKIPLARVCSGSASSGLLLFSKAIPLLAVVVALGAILTSWLSDVSTPAAQGAKLVYAGAIAHEGEQCRGRRAVCMGIRLAGFVWWAGLSMRAIVLPRRVATGTESERVAAGIPSG